MPGHRWLRDDRTQQNAIWRAIASAHEHAGYSFCQDCPSIVVCSSRHNADVAVRAQQMIKDWFQTRKVNVEHVFDDSDDWNLEILVNGVLLHSRSTQWHGFFTDERSQQKLVWRAVSDLLHVDQMNV